MNLELDRSLIPVRGAQAKQLPRGKPGNAAIGDQHAGFAAIRVQEHDPRRFAVLLAVGVGNLLPSGDIDG